MIEYLTMHMSISLWYAIQLLHTCFVLSLILFSFIRLSTQEVTFWTTLYSEQLTRCIRLAEAGSSAGFELVKVDILGRQTHMADIVWVVERYGEVKQCDVVEVYVPVLVVERMNNWAVGVAGLSVGIVNSVHHHAPHWPCCDLDTAGVDWLVVTDTTESNGYEMRASPNS